MSERHDGTEYDGTERDGTEHDGSDAADREPDAARLAQAGEGREADAATGSGDGDLATDVTLTDREAAANEAAERASRDPRGRALRWTLRGAAGLVAVGLAAGSIAAANALPEDARSIVPPPSFVVDPAAPLQTRACTGAALRVGTADGQDALAVTRVVDATLAIGSASGEQTRADLELADATGDGSTSVVEQRDGTTPLTAAEAVDADQEAVRGFAASECSEPAITQWLVGGSTRTGRAGVLTLANASDVPASVDIEVHGAEGRVESVGSTGIVVAPRGATAVDLAALAPQLDAAAVRVVSSGAPVTAHLQQTITRSLATGGFDVVDPQQAGTRVTLPGVELLAPTGLETNPDYDDLVPVLRLVAEDATSVSLRFLHEDGSVEEGAVDVGAGVVTDLPLDELGEGVVTIEAVADAPIAAAARLSAATDGGTDFDWVAAGRPLAASTPIAVPEGPSPVLHVVSTSEAAQEVVVAGEAHALEPGRALAVPVQPGTVEVQGDGLVVAVRYRGDGEVGSFTVTPQGPAAAGLTVLR